MCQCVFQMLLIPHLIRTYQDAVIGTESSSLPNPVPRFILSRRTSPAQHIRGTDIPVQVVDLLPQEDDCRGVLKAPIPPFIAPRAIAFFMANVGVFSKSQLTFRRHPPGEDIPVIRPSCSGIVTGLRRILGQTGGGGRAIL